MEILRSTVTLSLFFLGVIAFVTGLCAGVATATTVYSSQDLPQGTNDALPPTHLGHGRMMVNDKCGKLDIEINQSPTVPMPGGIPQYIVEITNTCESGCNISHIWLNCGWFSSARLINPKIFRRLRYNVCLVNDGKPLRSGAVLFFQYANTYTYPLSVSSVRCNV